MSDLALSRAVINDGLRPPMEMYSEEIMPFPARATFVKLLTRCWDGDPAARPLASEVRAELYELQKTHVKRRQSLMLGLPEPMTLLAAGNVVAGAIDTEGAGGGGGRDGGEDMSIAITHSREASEEGLVAAAQGAERAFSTASSASSA